MGDGDSSGDSGGSGTGSDFSWHKEMDKKQKAIDGLRALGRQKSKKITSLEAELEALKKAGPGGSKKGGSGSGSGESKGGGDGGGEEKKPKTNKEKFLWHDPRYWMKDKEEEVKAESE